MTKSRKSNVSSDRSSRFYEFYTLAFGDYLSARTLLLADLLPQGAAMASTAVEKIFKAILSIRGERVQGHLKVALLNSIKNYQPAIYSQLRRDFLEFLIAVYDLRYLDNLNTGHSLVINKYRTLAETDRTMCIILSGLQVIKNAEHVSLPFEQAKAEKLPSLMCENYFLEVGSTAPYFARENFVQEIKVFGPHEFVNATYRTEWGSDFGSFTKPVNLVKHKNGFEGQFSGG